MPASIKTFNNNQAIVLRFFSFFVFTFLIKLLLNICFIKIKNLFNFPRSSTKFFIFRKAHIMVNIICGKRDNDIR